MKNEPVKFPVKIPVQNLKVTNEIEGEKLDVMVRLDDVINLPKGVSSGQIRI